MKIFGKYYVIPPRILVAISLLCVFMPIIAGRVTYSKKFDVAKLDCSGVLQYEGNRYSQVKWDGLNDCYDEGAPNLPEAVVSLLVPTFSTDFSVSVTGLHSQTVQLMYPVSAVPPSIPISEFYENGETSALERDNDKFRGAASLRGDVISEDIMGGVYHIVKIRISPLVYDSDSNTIDVYSEVTVVLDYSECSADEMSFDCTLGQHKLPFPLDAIVDNPYDEVLMVNRAGLVARSGIVEGIDEYLVIGPRNSYEALRPLLDWKAQKGYNVVFQPIEPIYTYYTASMDPEIVDEAASLRAFIKERYAKCSGDLYCLLVGTPGKTRMPLRYFTRMNFNHSTDTTSVNGMYYTPTDSYFANVTYDWPLVWNSHNNCYVIPATTKGKYNFRTPDVIVGRLLCASSDEISNYIEKLLLYESNPGYGDNDYLSNAFIFEQDSNGASLLHKSNNVMNSLSEYFNVERYQDDMLDGIVWPEGKDVLDKMRVSGYNSWYGHGAPTHVAVSAGNQIATKYDDYTQWRGLTPLENYTEIVLNGGSKTPLVSYKHQGLDLLNNMHFPSIVYSISCDNAPMDIFKGDNANKLYDAKYNLASGFTVAGKYGGVAFLGNSRAGYAYTSPVIEQLFISGLGINPSIGKAQMYSKFCSDWNNSTYSHVLHEHYLCGEPEFSVWLSKPKTADASIIWQGDYIDISSGDLEGAKVVEFSGTGDIVVSSMESFVSLSGCPSKLYPRAPFIGYGIWKNGYLPIVELRHGNGFVDAGEFRFIVRRTVLGSSTDVYNNRVTMLSLEKKAKLKVTTLDELHLDYGFIMKGNASFTSERQRIANISNCKIADSSNLSISGQGTVIRRGFCIQKGATMSVLNEK